MNKFAVLIFAICITAIGKTSYAIPRPPENIKISITRDTSLTGFQGITMYFEWLGDSPGFDKKCWYGYINIIP